MREILFRGKQKEGRWVEGIYFKHDTVKVCFSSDATKPRHLIIQDGFCDWGFEPPIHCVDVDPKTVGQFTGLTDKNGKNIFEGDLLNGFEYPYYRSESNEHNYFAEVVWFDENCAFGLVTHKYPTSKVRGISAGNADYVEDFNPEEWEVIGNIHDNPELLEGE